MAAGEVRASAGADATIVVARQTRTVAAIRRRWVRLGMGSRASRSSPGSARTIAAPRTVYGWLRAPYAGTHMFYGRFQEASASAIASVFFVIGASAGVAFVLRELLGLDRTLVVIGWLCVLLVATPVAFVGWMRDWGPGSASARELDPNGPSDDQRTPLPKSPPKVTP